MMNLPKTFIALVVTGLLLLSAASAQAQTANPVLAALKRRALETPPATSTDEPEQSNLERQAVAQSGILDILERQKKALVGSWLRKTHAPDGDPLTDFLGLVTFHDDGTLTSSTAIDITTEPPFVTSVAHGAWMHQGGRVFDVTFVSTVNDLKGNLIAIAKLHQRITLDESGDKYTSRFTVRVTDAEGHSFDLAPGTEDGTRIKAEPFQ
ncbi:MAG: hypothetical protein HYR56_14145 [Acidobacteria bacterium]|nr:hypothetical protein [Acidobacteriota bacterium]MBI3421645.1 hypothetical protein [Acidobacteriota bacterium]